MSRIGVAISTRDRRKILEGSLAMWRRLMPPNSLLVVVDDASEAPVPPTHWGTSEMVIRNEHQLGVAMVKNKGIVALMDAGCDHLFLADDDIFPIVKDWWKPYVESLEPHLSFQWPRITRPSLRNNWRVVHDDGQHFALSFPRGVLLYAERRVINNVGGMDPAHGAWGGEHVEWSHRIHQAGLTTWPFADVCGSDKLWYSHDKEHGNTVGSTFKLSDRRKMAQRNGIQWDKHRVCGLYVPYRENDGWQDYNLGPFIPISNGEHYSLLDHVLGLHPAGTAVEFGVGSGQSTRLIAKHMPVMGFDSFEGLPTDWREGFPKGSFACPQPRVSNTTMVVGLFEDTLPEVRWPEYIGLVHLDADLYSSTRDALDGLRGHLKPGCYICFDEWWGYDGCADYEQLAWHEYAADTGLSWTVVGHSEQSWALRIT